jgi:hypothetical protein
VRPSRLPCRGRRRRASRTSSAARAPRTCRAATQSDEVLLLEPGQLLDEAYGREPGTNAPAECKDR